MVDKCANRIVGLEPFLTFISKCLSKCEYNMLIVLSILVFKINLMLINIVKILFCFFSCGGPQTLIILDFKLFQVFIQGPIFIFRNCEECLYTLSSFSDFNNRCDELFNEAINFQQTRPEVMDKVYDESFNM